MNKQYVMDLIHEVSALSEFCNVPVTALARYVGSTHNIFNKYLNGGRTCSNRIHVAQMEKMRDVMNKGIISGVLPLPKEINRKKMNSAYIAELLEKVK